MAKKHAREVDANVLVQQMRVQLQELQDEKGGLAKQVTNLKTAFTKQTTKVDKLETTISDLRAHLKDRAALSSNREAEFDATIKKLKDKLAAKRRKYKEKLAAKEKELAAATAPNNETEKKVTQSPCSKTTHTGQPTSDTIVPKKRTYDEAAGYDVIAWERYLERQLGKSYYRDIDLWRKAYEAAELLEGSSRPERTEAYKKRKEEADERLQFLKQCIVVKERRAQELRDLQSRFEGNGNAARK